MNDVSQSKLIGFYSRQQKTLTYFVGICEFGFTVRIFLKFSVVKF
jgi:hypothetical protein